MKFSCDRDALLHEISIAQEIISSRNALSILSNVLLETGENTLFIKATDLKVGFETSIPVEVIQTGVITVFCDKLLGILKTLPEGEVEFDQQEGRLTIKPRFKKISFQLKSIPADKFPELQTAREDSFFQVPQKDLAEMIAQTVFAVSDDETRYFMNGVYLERKENSLAMVATDGRRLAFVSKPIGAEVVSFNPVIVPPKILTLMKKFLTGEGTVSMAVSDKNVFFRINNQKLFSNLIEGQFPNYARVIPHEQQFAIQLSKSDLSEALRRVSLLVEQKSRRVFMKVSPNVIVLNAEESEIGAAKEEIPCSYEGPEATIALNYLYLSEPLRVIEEDAIRIEYTEPTKAITLRAVPEREYFHIVMPMQID